LRRNQPIDPNILLHADASQGPLYDLYCWTNSQGVSLVLSAVFPFLNHEFNGIPFSNRSIGVFPGTEVTCEYLDTLAKLGLLTDAAECNDLIARNAKGLCCAGAPVPPPVNPPVPPPIQPVAEGE
jgi:hypothetical protein